MNKKELIERIEGLKNLFGNKSEYIEIDMVIRLISELDEPQPNEEPQKVVVSEEEAKFLETFDFNSESDVTTALYYVSRTGWGYYLKNNNGIVLKDLTEGMELEDRKRLIKAILDGYEVEKEKRYLVKIIGITNYNSYLNYHKKENKWTIESNVEVDAIRTGHTRKELEEAGFEWVFDCPGVEVKEVVG